MLVRDIMTPNPITIGPESDYLAAIALMRARKCRHLPVVDQEKGLVGIITDYDVRAVRSEGTPKERALLGDGVLVRVREVMTPNVITVPPDFPLEEAAALMVQHHISCLPVVAEGQVTGIITDTDIFRTLANMLGGGSQTIRLAVQVDNKPGQIAALAGRIAAVGGNILSIASHPASTPDHMRLTLRVESAPLDEVLSAIRGHLGAIILNVWDQSQTSGEG